MDNMRPGSRRPPGSSLRSMSGEPESDGGDRPSSKQPSSPIAGFLGAVFGGGDLPPVVRNFLGLPGPEPSPSAKKVPEFRAGMAWQDVCYIHSIPGDDNAEGLLVLADGTMRKYIGLKGLNTLLFDEAERGQMAKHFGALANSLESDVQIIIKSRSISVEDYLDRHQIPAKTDVEYLKWYADYTDKWYRRTQELNFVPQRDFYLVVSFQPPDCKHLTKQWNGRRSIHKHEEFLETLNRMCKTAMDNLRAANLRPQILTKKEIRKLIYTDLNPAQVENSPEPPPSRPDISEASCLARSALKISDAHILLDGKYVGTQYMAEPPHEDFPGWLEDLLKLTVEYTLSMFIHVSDQSESGRKKVQSDFRDYQGGYDKAFDISFYMRAHADTPEKLAQNMDEIRKVFKERGAIMDRGQMLQLEAWQSTLAVGVDSLAIVHRMPSQLIGTFWPFFTPQCGTPDGVPFGFAIASREPVLLNPFFRGQGKETNNMFVTGSTGAGKSFAVSMLILRLLPLGVRFTLIDKTVDQFGAYRFITELLGPELCDYVYLGPSGGRIVNPFDLGPDDGDPANPSPDKVNGILSLLDIMLAPEGVDELNGQEKSLLDGLIRVAYMDASLRGTVPTMSDITRVTAQAAADEVDPMQRERLQQFARGLSLYTRSGPFGGLVDGYTNIDSEKLFIVFDTRELNDPRLDRMAVFILAEFIKRKAAECKARGLRYAAIVDEAAMLMRFRAGARLMDGLSKQASHYGMMLVTITQQLKDFFRPGDQAASVVANSHMKILLRQDPSDLKILKESLRMTDAEIIAVSNFPPQEEKRSDSQLLLVVGGVHGTVRLVPSGMDYWICTSEPTKDIPRRSEMIREVKMKNPKLNQTDACRQAVYYLGLQHE